MGYLLEALGRGLPDGLRGALNEQLPSAAGDKLVSLLARRAASPTSIDIALRLGTAFLRDLRLADARVCFEQALRDDRAQRGAAIGLACVEDELGDAASARVYLERVRAADPDDPAVAFGIALCLERESDARAADAYRRALELCPRLQNAHERLAAIAIQDRDYEAAARCYAALVELTPNDISLLGTLATLHLTCGRSERAAELFQRALLIDPESGDDTIEQADLVEDEARLLEAVASVQKLVSKYPGVTEFHLHLADLFVKLGDDDNAVRHFSAALEIHPDFLEATVKLGTQHLRRKRYAQAARTFNKAVELNDRLLTAFIGLGVAQRASGNEREARSTLDLACSLAPNSTLLFCETARLRLKAARRRAAPDDSFVESLDVSVDTAHEDLTTLALRRCRAEAARHPLDADGQYRLAMMLRQCGDFEGSRRALQRAIGIHPNFCRARVKLGIGLLESGFADLADEQFRAAMTLPEDQINLNYELALLYSQRGRFDLAVEAGEFENAVDPDPESAGRNLTLALENLGLIDRAQASWNSVAALAGSDAGLNQARSSRRDDEIL